MQPQYVNQKVGFSCVSWISFNKRIWQILTKKTERPHSDDTLLGTEKHECKLLQAEEEIGPGFQTENQ